MLLLLCYFHVIQLHVFRQGLSNITNRVKYRRSKLAKKVSLTSIAHSSTRPGPAAACKPGLLCASSKFCRQPK